MSIAMVQLLNYCDTHMYAVIQYKKSDMIIVIHSDASYSSKPKVSSWAGRNFFFKIK